MSDNTQGHGGNQKPYQIQPPFNKSTPQESFPPQQNIPAQFLPGNLPPAPVPTLQSTQRPMQTNNLKELNKSFLFRGNVNCMRVDFGSQKAAVYRNEPETPELCCPGMLSAEEINKHVNECLCEFKEVNEFDKSCISKVNELMVTQKHLYDVVSDLEKREKESIDKLQQADCMWSCMEEAYKNKIEQANERQKLLLNKLKELETNNSQWKKMKIDLELQIKHVKNSEKEMSEKIAQKNNDFKIIESEIEGFKKRVEDGQKETESLQKSYETKKKNMDAQIKYINDQIAEKTKAIAEESKKKKEKEQEGNKMIKEARDDLQKSWKVLLQKRLENEDLKIEKETILRDIEMLETINNECIMKCTNNQNEILKQIKDLDEKIRDFKIKCTHCHRSVDTEDVRIHCTDCPRCARQRECLRDGDTCVRDPANECACMATKRRFMDNVFENMFIVLERYIKTNAGKAVGNVVVESLKHSKNGKLDKRTRKILQDFILTTIRKNLNLTIVGGAIKTRCEMDPDSFKELMLCLREIKVVEPIKEDKSTNKKPPCQRWKSAGIECNCYGGPNSCACCKRQPPSASPGVSYFKSDEDPEERCPETDKICGPECGMHGQVTGEEMASWRPDPCRSSNCNISNRDMRAAQCILKSDYTNEDQEFKPRKPAHEKKKIKICESSHEKSASPIPSTSPKDPKESVSKPFDVIYLKPGLSKHVNIPELEKKILSLGNTSYKLFQEQNEQCLIDNPYYTQISRSKLNEKDKALTSSILKHEKNVDLCNERENFSNTTIVLKAHVKDPCNRLRHNPKYRLHNSFNKHVKFGNEFYDSQNLTLNTQNKSNIKKRLVKTETGFKQGKLPNIFLKTKLCFETKTVAVLTCNHEPLKILKSASKEMPLYMKKLLSKCTETDDNINKNQDESLTIKEAKAYLNMTKSGLFKVHIDENYDPSKKWNNKDYYKVILKSEKYEIEPPLILKQTAPNDFHLVIDSEYEQIYKKVIKSIMENGDCLTLRRRSSGTFVFNIGEVAATDRQKKVMVVDSPIRHSQETRNRYNLLKSISFGDVTCKLENTTVSAVGVKGMSDTKLYINSYKTALQNHKFIMSSSTLTKVNPGEYALNLDFDMKRKFFDNLKELFRNSQDFSPLILNTPGEIIIALLYKHDDDVRKEVFKITSSGDVYLLKRENLISAPKTQSIRTHPTCVFNLNKHDKSVATCFSNVCGEKCDARKCDCAGTDILCGKIKNMYPDIEVYSSGALQNDHDSEKGSQNHLSCNGKNIDIPAEESLAARYQIHDEKEADIEADVEMSSKSICFESAPSNDIRRYVEHMPFQLPPFLGCQWDLCPCKYKATT